MIVELFVKVEVVYVQAISFTGVEDIVLAGVLLDLHAGYGLYQLATTLQKEELPPPPKGEAMGEIKFRVMQRFRRLKP